MTTTITDLLDDFINDSDCIGSEPLHFADPLPPRDFLENVRPIAEVAGMCDVAVMIEEIDAWHTDLVTYGPDSFLDADRGL